MLQMEAFALSTVMVIHDVCIASLYHAHRLMCSVFQPPSHAEPAALNADISAQVDGLQAALQQPQNACASPAAANSSCDVLADLGYEPTKDEADPFAVTPQDTAEASAATPSG